ncbi:Rab5-interacting protein-domain-containing protein [Trichoderma sp. SZMC 28011]
MSSEQELQINPIVQDSVAHNTKTLSNLHSLTASLFGVGAGILGLESYYGFLFYIAFSIATSLLFYILQIAPSSLGEGRSVLDSGRYYRGALELWTSGIFNGLPGFILTWTLFYGLVRA